MCNSKSKVKYVYGSANLLIVNLIKSIVTKEAILLFAEYSPFRGSELFGEDVTRAIFTDILK